MIKYLRQLTQVSIVNFFFIISLFFIVEKYGLVSAPLTSSSLQKPSPTPLPSTNLPSPFPTETQIAPINNFFSELSSHSSKSDCWIAIQGHIYNVTTYFGSHPGGDDVIVKYCGTDATTPFTTKDGIGANHSATAYNLLRGYLIQ